MKRKLDWVMSRFEILPNLCPESPVWMAALADGPVIETTLWHLNTGSGSHPLHLLSN